MSGRSRATTRDLGVMPRPNTYRRKPRRDTGYCHHAGFLYQKRGRGLEIGHGEAANFLKGQELDRFWGDYGKNRNGKLIGLFNIAQEGRRSSVGRAAVS